MFLKEKFANLVVKFNYLESGKGFIENMLIINKKIII